MEQTEKKPYGKGKVFGLSCLIFVLVLVLSTVLLVCVTAYRHVYYDPVAEAAASVPLQDTLVRTEDGQTMYLASFINQNYVKQEHISDNQIKYILRDGDFNLRVGEKAGMIAQYIALHKNHPDDVTLPTITQDDIHYAVEANESTIRLHTGLNDATVLEAPINANSAPACEAYNQQIRVILTEGLSAVLIDIAVSHWIWYALGGVLLLLLIWMIAVHARGNGSTGTGFKVYAVAAFIPCVVLLLWGLLCVWIFGLAQAAYLQAPAAVLRHTWIAVGGFGALGCVVLFCIGTIVSRFGAKESAAPAAVTVPDETAAPASIPDPPKDMTRRYCRFCGKELVNGDAMFCYKCGTKQAEIDKEKEKDTVG